ncbi:hypothetical protein GQ53DRAFT_822695 [Thozetella sp. PMI_491]|nr:hypothetical protein GQ53DRAFT_822695 [Thozetella sp. PMI_491]
MHELFLTAIIADSDVPQARAILRGICATRERHGFSHLVFYHQPAAVGQPQGLPALKGIQKHSHAANLKQWAELHQIFTKLSFVVQVRYDLDENALKQGNEPASDAAKLGVFRWNDIPEPTGPRAVIHVQRRMLEIKDKNLDRILQENKMARKSHAIEETYKWYRDGLEFTLSRVYGLNPDLLSPPDQDGPALPPLSQLDPILPSWTLIVRTIAPDSTPAQVQQAVAQLHEIHAKLMGVFEFKLFDRRVHDTRNVAMPQQQHLPQAGVRA